MKKSKLIILVGCIAMLIVTSACSLFSNKKETSANLQKTITALENQVQSQDQTVSPEEATALVTPIDPYPLLVLPFEDNFDDGLDSAWRIDQGQPMILDGKLTSSTDQLIVEIGNIHLNQYTLEFNVWGKDPEKCDIDYYTNMSVSFSPTLKYSYEFIYDYGDSVWYTYDSEKDKWNEVSRKGHVECGKFRISVNDNSYQLYNNGLLVDELVFTPATGPLVITLEKSITFDNLTIQ